MTKDERRERLIAMLWDFVDKFQRWKKNPEEFADQIEALYAETVEKKDNQ